LGSATSVYINLTRIQRLSTTRRNKVGIIK